MGWVLGAIYLFGCYVAAASMGGFSEPLPWKAVLRTFLWPLGLLVIVAAYTLLIWGALLPVRARMKKA